MINVQSTFSGTVHESIPDGSHIPEIIMITSYPPRECGIATYSQDLVNTLRDKFDHSFMIRICALESANEKHSYHGKVYDVLNVDQESSYISMAQKINANATIGLVVIQHEFGFFEGHETLFTHFLNQLNKPIAIVFHTVLPHPTQILKEQVVALSGICKKTIVMTKTSASILSLDYGIAPEKMVIIPHGTHLVTHANKEKLKLQHHLSGRRILSTFGLLSSGKSIETTLDALPAIVKQHPDILFLIIGKTHPGILLHEGETYREMLEAKISKLNLAANVRFINQFLPLPELLAYLQLTDIYLFTSKDPNQAVSGTFAYAISCGCPIISTPIPHAKEVLGNDAGLIIDFGDSVKLSESVLTLLRDEELRNRISTNGLQKMASTAWENVAVSYANLFASVSVQKLTLHYAIHDINIRHVHKLTTQFGMIQFSKIYQPDIESGYTLDDNARALIAMCQYFNLTGDKSALGHIRIYLEFIQYCQQPSGSFLNYVDEQMQFTSQNETVNLSDSNGRAIWALGYLISMGEILPETFVQEAKVILRRALYQAEQMHSTRSMAFVIKGLYYAGLAENHFTHRRLIISLADRLVQMYKHEAEHHWLWYEGYLTYANSVIPEGLLCAWLATGDEMYKDIAKSSFDFLLSKTFSDQCIKVVTNKFWMNKNEQDEPSFIGGEQPIDVAYTILTLEKFYKVFREESYLYKMKSAFDWFSGKNELHQIVYNPCTGGCYDGLEAFNVNLNQGAESTISYLLARLSLEEMIKSEKVVAIRKKMNLLIRNLTHAPTR